MAGHIQRRTHNRTGKILILTDVISTGVVRRPRQAERSPRISDILPCNAPPVMAVEIPEGIEEAQVTVTGDEMDENIEDDTPF
jgi:hypothetical protein